MIYVGALFEKQPGQWGLRGDPHLWAELQQNLAATLLPTTEDALKDILDVAYYNATGTYLIEGQDVTIPRLAHGGMSSGMVSGTFWRDRALPFLLERFRAEN